MKLLKASTESHVLHNFTLQKLTQVWYREILVTPKPLEEFSTAKYGRGFPFSHVLKEEKEVNMKEEKRLNTHLTGERRYKVVFFLRKL